jgi:capsular polysaccharide export protein
LSGVRVLLLQGPVGGFFASLAKFLRSRGHETTKVNFNAGDFFFARGKGVVNFPGGPREWRSWLKRELRKRRPDAVLMFGDRRPVHRIAIVAAKRFGVPVFSFEEGYLRPHYVTFERGGNNAHSPLPREPSAYGGIAASQPPRQLPHHFAATARRAVLYYCARTLGMPLFPGHMSHRPRNIFIECYFWYRSILRHSLASRRDRRRIDEFTGPAPPRFFMMALQVHNDLQLVSHGRGWQNARLIREVIGSFAVHAPRHAQLVIKVHPMDRGHRNYARKIRESAEYNGVSDRVIVLETGPLAPIVRAALGLVTVNSTSALAALAHGVPVAVLGEAFYAIDGLARRYPDIESLAGFWTAPPRSSPEFARRFIDRLTADCLLMGSFYLPKTWPALFADIEARLLRETATEAG